MKITIFDSTLRDGAQAEGISFSVEDKIKVARALDKLGVDYIEAGNPGSNPKDLAFFNHFGKNGTEKLSHAKLVAFGSTRRKGILPQDDKNLNALLEADTETVCIFGKSWDFHVKEILNAELEENLAMIRDTIAFLKSKGKEVFFDAEHYFDGYKNNPSYALECLKAATEGGAEALVLCDTNGGCYPPDLVEIINKTKEYITNADSGLYKFYKDCIEAGHSLPLGIHAHNDCEMAVANSVMAVQETGVIHVQGTFTGFGERCGNANLSAIIPNLQIKLGHDCIFPEALQELTQTARYISEIANISLNERAAYVGQTAFAHKGGMHIDAVTKVSESFEHINPHLVGNERRYLMSEVAGRSTLLSKIQKVNPAITKDSPEAEQIIEKLKELEHYGYQFEAAESSFALYIRKQLGKYQPLFELVNFKIIGEQPHDEGLGASAVIKVTVNGQTEITAAEGNGPVNALDAALRKALEKFYPELNDVQLTDYKVRVLEGNSATASKVRVLIESSDGKESWTTVGVSTDIIEASWLALVDSIEHKLIREIESKVKAFI